MFGNIIAPKNVKLNCEAEEEVTGMKGGEGAILYICALTLHTQN
jgi:hypothetical protein